MKGEVFRCTKKGWITYLLALLSLEIANLISRENEEQSSDYDYVKKVFLRFFKLAAEQFL